MQHARQTKVFFFLVATATKLVGYHRKRSRSILGLAISFFFFFRQFSKSENLELYKYAIYHKAKK